MRTILTAIVITIGLTGWAQNSKASQGKDDTTPTALEDQWVRALEKGDAATLDSIFADTYVDTDDEGNRTNKQGVLSAVKSGDLKIQSLTLSDIQTHRYGEAAVVTGSSAQIGAYKGTPLASHIVFYRHLHSTKWKVERGGLPEDS